MLLVIGIVGGGVVVWFAYTIKSLCDLSYHDQKDLCPGSNAWLYLLLTVSLFTNWITPTTDLKSWSKVQVIIGTFVQLGITSWGCAEMLGVPCIDQLYDTTLYLMLAITVVLNLINTTASFVLIAMY
jgi:hypothetical protein